MSVWTYIAVGTGIVTGLIGLIHTIVTLNRGNRK